MLSITKATNQYFGKYFENAICAHINGDEIKNLTEFNNFTNEDIQIMNEDAKNIADYINAKHADWVGNETSNENCDIIADNEHIEIKYVSKGNGTYFNTSIYGLIKYGFNFKDYLRKYGYYTTLEKQLIPLNIEFSKENNSPVNQRNSSFIRHNYPEVAKIIQDAESIARTAFIKDLVSYFTNNENDLYLFLSDMINKDTLTIHKTKPDRIIIYNYDNKSITDIDINTLNIKGNIGVTEKGFYVGDLRIQIGWQNGNGLNNPTIRVFIK